MQLSESKVGTWADGGNRMAARGGIGRRAAPNTNFVPRRGSRMASARGRHMSRASYAAAMSGGNQRVPPPFHELLAEEARRAAIHAAEAARQAAGANQGDPELGQRREISENSEEGRRG